MRICFSVGRCSFSRSRGERRWVVSEDYCTETGRWPLLGEGVTP